ncbi:FLYWCH family member 2 [Elephas maximus indicus]|uniref:FLYWCH family member 2 n=1 Tax=Elephas maximus indicus TaxID=99487 RepID=UPI002115F987|nr:FLYWCH family member 2 [Elephas maximus indicus]XP_049760216.1 FLYWCH family member 2 [Elephas maximus indicus]XP_049760217.1 FLYWCH family member 2 [Elephas maximus indicus]XP_049760218.1 FLYWCH family member 2 [Elephas maximus indicus]XP_049760219.1 FLYWCH family member 2 [Elephas maximus indicus]XP_049760220.1 FLYWCH family member 2 [Elephas maximus indicus]XP_049760221.1 FLYWCH family member 2 [Elephas maximus indicus]
MPLQESRDQEGESMRAGQEPARESVMGVVSATPRIPKKFSKLILLTASKDSAKVPATKRKGVHCIMSLGLPGPTTLAKALLKIHPEAQRAIEAAPQEPEPKRSRLDTDAEGKGDGRLTWQLPPTSAMEGEESAPSQGGAGCALPGTLSPAYPRNHDNDAAGSGVPGRLRNLDNGAASAFKLSG